MDGGGLSPIREESVRVEDDDEDDGEAAEAIDLREVAAGGGLSLEGGEEAGGPGGHFLFRLWSRPKSRFLSRFASRFFSFTASFFFSSLGGSGSGAAAILWKVAGAGTLKVMRFPL